MSAVTSVFVFGITGQQGSSVAKSLLEAGVKVVGLSRSPDSDKAKAVAATGVQIIKGDMDRPDTYAAALEKVDGVFLNLDFWQFYNGSNAEESQAKEEAQGRKVVDVIHRAAQAGTMRHLVFSTLERVENPHVPIPHGDSKDAVTQYIKSLKIPATQLYTCFYFSNVLMQTLTAKADGSVQLDNPMPDDTVVPSFAVEQTGLWAAAAFKDPKKWINKDMYAVGQNVTVKEYADVLSSVLGTKVVTENRTLYGFMTDIKTEREWWVQQLVMVNGQFSRSPEQLKESKALAPGAWDFKAWAQQSEALKAKFANFKK